MHWDVNGIDSESPVVIGLHRILSYTTRKYRDSEAPRTITWSKRVPQAKRETERPDQNY